MTSRVYAVLTLGALLVSLWSVSAAAQNSCSTPMYCSAYNLLNVQCVPALPATAQCITVVYGTAFCLAKSNVCAPPPWGKCPYCGSPIDLATGNAYITQVDLKNPGLGGGLSLVRTWDSISPGENGVGLFGAGWSSTYEESVSVGSDGYMKYAKGNGDIWSLGFSGRDASGNPQFSVAGSATGNQSLTLTQAPSNWILVFQNGEQRLFDGTSGKLLSITDRNGNTTQLTYDASFRLVTVTDPASRHLYFSYASPSTYLVTALTSDFGVSLSYQYDNLGRLVQYTKPDNTTVSFQYNDPNPNLITSVLDANGKVLESHTYNSCAQGLTSARAGGVEAVTLSYPLACHVGFLASPP